MRTMGMRALALGIAVAAGTTFVATAADAAVVICQKKNKLKLRVDACKANETQVAATELGAGAAGYAHVLADGTVDLANSKNVTQANVTLASTSAYCFSGLPFTFQSAVATPDYGDPVTGGVSGLESTVALGDPWGDCETVVGTQLEVATSISGVFAPAGFFVVFN